MDNLEKLKKIQMRFISLKEILSDNMRDLANKDKKIYELENMVDDLVKKVAELTKIISDLQSQVDKLNENPSVVTIPASEWELNEVEKSFVANLVEKIRKFFGF
jgi:peptidoglycan hydrolase CwlO-like protein